MRRVNGFWARKCEISEGAMRKLVEMMRIEEERHVRDEIQPI
jgi:hypothetical protein